MTTTEFTCGHCKILVKHGGHNRNACPSCGWSKHLMYGSEVGCDPCGALMEPVRILRFNVVVWYCTGCNFMIKGPPEKELKRLRRTGGKVNWRTGVQGDMFRHHIVECVSISA